MFKCAHVEGGQAERTQTLFPGRVQHQERLPGQGHLCPVRTTICLSGNISSLGFTQMSNHHFFVTSKHYGSLFYLLYVQGLCLVDDRVNNVNFFSNRLFEWLVTFINNSICADKSTWANFIGEHFSVFEFL